MPKFRKKPIEIEAVNCGDVIIAANDSLFDLPEWVQSAYSQGILQFCGDQHISIKTLEGTMQAEVSDWIIRGVKGEIYPCKPDIFEATYEPVERTDEELFPRTALDYDYPGC